MSAPAGRDLRLDLFRGLALWLIFLDHIPSNIVNWLTIRNYGFSDAAEIFVFISGYTAAFVYGHTMDQRGVVVASARILKRAWTVYIAHVFIFPALIGGLIAVHLALVALRHHTQFRQSSPLATHRRLVGVPMFPGQAPRSLGLMVATAAVLFGLGGVVYFFLPWFWWLRRQVRLCQEYLADAAVAAGEGRPEEYAPFLLGLTPAPAVPAGTSSIHASSATRRSSFSLNPLKSGTRCRCRILASPEGSVAPAGACSASSDSLTGKRSVRGSSSIVAS